MLLEVVNQALSYMGQTPMQTWDEKPNLRRQVEAMLPIALDSFAVVGDWTFAKHRAQLDLQPADETWSEYPYKAEIPDGTTDDYCIRVLGTRPSRRFEIEGNTIYIDAHAQDEEADPVVPEDITLLYIRRLWTTDPVNPGAGDSYTYELKDVRMPPAAVDAMAYGIAARMAVGLSGDVQITGLMKEEYANAIAAASATSEEENPGYNPRAGSNDLLEVVNEALVLANQKPVTSWVVSSQVMEAVKAVIPRAIGSLTSEVYWSFAKTRVAMDLYDGEAFEWNKYSNRFHIPEDCVRVISVDGGAQYEIEGNLLYTDNEDAELLYIRRVYETDAHGNPAFSEGLRVPTKFREALSYRIAQDIATRLTQDPGMAMMFQEQYRMALRGAIEENEMETPGRIPMTEAWTAQDDRTWGDE